MDTIYASLIVFVLYCIISDWFMHEYDEKLNSDNFYKFKIDSFFSYQIPALKRLVSLNEESLAKQPVFWIGIFLPLIVASWIEYQIILLNPELLSFQNLDHLFKASTSALYISALIPTLGVIISNIHKTIQTEKQIKASEGKNTLDGFYAHYKYLTEEFRKLDEKKERIVIINPNKLYKKIFVNSSYLNGVGKLSEDFIINIFETINNINNSFNEINIKELDSLCRTNDINVKKLVSDLMNLNDDYLAGIDNDSSEILKLLESEPEKKFNIHENYRKNYINKFANPYFDDEYDNAQHEGNWHILRCPDLVYDEYVLENIIDFFNTLNQVFRMNLFLIGKIVDILDINNKLLDHTLFTLKNNSYLIDNIVENVEIEKRKISSVIAEESSFH
ncbi:hypothetical protein [Providencia vermicola]|uniref:hypothetical protein n=1 Tax=Providencia vermicola TaxID=333965 RepID=UPI003D2CD051